MKVWNGRFEEREDNPLLEAFNASIHDDAFLLDAEIRASLAYASALNRASILTPSEFEAIRSGLERVRSRIRSGENLAQFEDIHSAVELMLTEETGETGKKLHTGRSRNEQVATDERLFLKERMPEILLVLTRIQETVLGLAEDYSNVVMPGYTHLQQGQPVLFAHYILSLFWQMERGKDRLRDALKRIDALPLGSGALAGSTVPLDRDHMREILGFASVTSNSMDAVSDRSFILEVLFALSLVFLDVSRACEDFIVFTSKEFGLIKLDDSIATSSSLMPQKKNPDFFELLRAGAGRMFGLASQLFITVKGLPSTYNKDLQWDKEPLHRGVDDAVRMLKIFHLILERITPDAEAMRSKLDPLLLATDLADYLVERGVPFREAHGIVGAVVRHAEMHQTYINALSVDALRQFSDAFGDDVSQVFDFTQSVRRKKTTGSTHPDQVRRQIEEAQCILSNSEGTEA